MLICREWKAGRIKIGGCGLHAYLKTIQDRNFSKKDDDVAKESKFVERLEISSFGKIAAYFEKKIKKLLLTVISWVVTVSYSLKCVHNTICIVCLRLKIK